MAKPSGGQGRGLFHIKLRFGGLSPEPTRPKRALISQARSTCDGPRFAVQIPDAKVEFLISHPPNTTRTPYAVCLSAREVDHDTASLPQIMPQKKLEDEMDDVTSNALRRSLSSLSSTTIESFLEGVHHHYALLSRERSARAAEMGHHRAARLERNYNYPI
ncbi:hypothetical protein CC78DRAFT_575888 [Lojkania enalia]|uniref:Uncharacterized protein n=1 Tax=Lojkania enalia TaxID=147567 RepID=A0A9P4KHR1_9PLEO|nr:hypothetical protein CC78DRAFT_575888 [Didymosphaeria enalia]